MSEYRKEERVNDTKEVNWKGGERKRWKNRDKSIEWVKIR